MFVFLDADLAADADEDPYEERVRDGLSGDDARTTVLFQNVKNTVLDEFFVAHARWLIALAAIGSCCGRIRFCSR